MTNFFGSTDGAAGRVLFLGAPLDRDIEKKGSCAAAPGVLRQISSIFDVKSSPIFDIRRRKLCLLPKVSDIGNIVPAETDTLESFLQRISNSIHLVNAAGKIPFVIGGDHLITLGVLMGMQMADQEFQVIHLDAHSDTELEARKSSRLNNGNFVNRAAALPRIKSWVHVGGRGYTGLVPKLPNNYFSCEPSNIERHLTSGMPVYLTIDSDFFDPSIFPAVNFPVPDGYNSEVFLNILGAIAASGSRIIGVDWVEYNPDRDDDLKQSGRFVVQHVIEVLSLIAVVDSRLARCTPMIARDVRSLVQNQAADGS